MKEFDNPAVDGENVRYRQRRTVDDEESAPETALPEVEASFKGTVVSSTDGAKILNNRGKVAEESRNKSCRTKTFIGDMARAFGARPYGSGSQYTTFETRNGKIVTIRLADHNDATTIRFILIRSILPTALTGTWLNTQRSVSDLLPTQGEKIIAGGRRFLHQTCRRCCTRNKPSISWRC